MEFLAYFRLAVLLVSTVVFSLLISKLVRVSLTGFRLVWAGFGLIILNLIVGSLFHSHMIPEPLKELFPTIGFLTGYVGQTLGLVLIPIGIYKVVSVLVPRLEQSESLYEQFVHSIDGILYEVDASDFRFTFVSNKSQQVLGYSPQQWLKKVTWEKIIHPDDLDYVFTYCAAAVQDRRNHSIEFRAVTADGRVIWLRDVATVIVEPDQSVKIRGVLLDVTDRKRAEESLQESEERLRTIINADPQCLKLLAADGTILQMNPAGLAMIEAENEDVVRGQCAYPLVVSEHRRAFQSIIEQAFQGRSGWLQFEITGLKGTRRWMETHVVPLRNGKGEIVAALGITNDITEQKCAKEALDTKSAYFEQLFRKSPAGIVLLDTDDRIIDANESFQRLFQYLLEEIKGRSINDLLVPDILLTEAVGLSKQTQRGKTVHKETFRKRSDGSLLPVQITAYPIQVNDRQVGMYAIYTDITARKHAQDVLQESEERYRNLVESARDMIFSISPQGFIMSMNPAFETGTGWRRDEWVGRSFTDLVHPDDLSKAIEVLSTALQGVRTDIQEYRIKTKSGDYIVGEITITRQMKDGKIVGLLGIARDVTARKKLEDQIRHTQKMESIGTLATGIAHDFNNILGIIMAYTAALEHPQSDRLSKATSTAAIMKAVQRAANLVRQILTLARKHEQARESVKVNATIEELGGMLSETFPKTIEIVRNLDPTDPIVLIDSTQLTQLLLNLCVNARDAMPAGGTLTLTTAVLNGAELSNNFPNGSKGEYVNISVADTGTGMNEQTRQRVFEPFFTTKEPGNGTGMGLAVVYGIVKSYGGIIDVKSEVGRGTIFHLYFPATVSPSGAPHSPQSEAQELPKGTETILLVEDEELLGMLVKNILETSGFKVEWATDGKAAISFYRLHQDKIDLVLSDLGLPKLNGPDLIRELKKLDPQLRIVVATGYLAPVLKTELQRSGIRDFIHKPYQAAEVIRAIRNALDSSSPVPSPQ